MSDNINSNNAIIKYLVITNVILIVSLMLIFYSLFYKPIYNDYKDINAKYINLIKDNDIEKKSLNDEINELERNNQELINKNLKLQEELEKFKS